MTGMPPSRKLDELNARVEDPTLWDRPAEAQAVDPARARRLGRAASRPCRCCESDLKPTRSEYAELADMEGDEAPARGRPRPAQGDLKERAGRAELEALLSGEADGNDGYVEINSGAGGTESSDWAGMLLRMYQPLGHRPRA